MPPLVDRVIAPYFATNCWIISVGAGNEAIVVDPGIAQPNMAQAIRAKLAEHHLKASAILITHGHLDHTFSVVPLQEDVGIDRVLIHTDDRDLLTRPERAMGEQGRELLKKLRSSVSDSINFEPSGLEPVPGDVQLDLAGMKISLKHTPGHTPGSLVAIIEDSHLVSGDTLFAGSIGRTDLRRGSISDMEITLREKIATLPDHLEVLPGHGNRTNLGVEKRENSYLIAAIQRRLA